MLSFAVTFPAPLLPRMSAGSAAGGAAGGGDAIPRGRLTEFASAGGDRVVQDALAREALWRAAQAGLTDVIDGKIAEFDAGASARLSGLFDRGGRDIAARNEQFALRAALADLARWNYSWREGRAASRQKRQEIEAELAAVNKLLLSVRRKPRPATRWRRRRRGGDSGAQVLVGGGGGAAADGGVGVRGVPAVAALGFVSFVCLGGMRGFEAYVQKYSAESLVRVSFAGLGLICMGVYSHALLKLAEEEARLRDL
jgi:hypothetical protein